MKWIKGKVHIRNSFIVWLFFFITLVFVNIPVIMQMGTIRMGSDEYNILSISAYITGHDWSSYNESINAYHGFGSALFYIPLFWMFKDISVIHKAALVENTLFLSFIPTISYYIIKKYFHINHKLFRVLTSIIIAVYPFYLISNKHTWSENLIILFAWLNVLLALKVIEHSKTKFGIYWVMLYSAVAGFSYMIHGRCIIFIILTPVTILYSILQDNQFSKKQLSKYFMIISSSVVIMVILYALNSFGINYFKNHLWHADEMRNTMESLATDRIQYLTKWASIKVMIKMVWGQLYYMTVVTLGIAMFAFAVFIINLWNWITRKTIVEKYDLFLSIYLLLAYLGSLAISILGLVSGVIQGSQRTDYIIWGRHTEPLFPILIWFVLIHCFKKQTKNKEIISGILGAILAIGLFIKYSLPLYLSMKSNGHSSIASILPWLRMTIFSALPEDISQRFAIIGIICILLMFIIGILLYKIKVFSIIFLCSISFLYSYIYVSNQITIPYSQNVYTWMTDIQDFYNKYKIDEQKLFFISENTRYPSELQLEFGDRNLVLLYDPLNPQEILLDKVDFSQSIILSEGNSFINLCDDETIDIALFDHAKYLRLEDNVLIILGDELQNSLKSQGCVLYDSWQEGGNVTQQLSSFSKNSPPPFISDGKSGFLVYGPYITIPRGDYMVDFSLECTPTNFDLGYCDVTTENGAKVLSRTPLTADMFSNNEAIITLPFSLFSETNNLEFRLYTNEGTNLKLTNLLYRSVPGVYTAFRDNPVEIQQLTANITNYNFSQTVIYMNTSEDSISLDYLQQHLPQYELLINQKSDVIMQKPSAYIITDRASLEWIALLDDYTLLKHYDNHVLLIKSTLISDKEPVHVLSDGKNVSLTVFQSRSEKAFISQKYDISRGGIYQVILNIDPLQEDAAPRTVYVEVLADNIQIRNMEVVSNSGQVIFPVEIDTVLNDVEFRIYSKEQQQLLSYNTGAIRQIKDRTEYYYDSMIRPLITMGDDITYDCPITFITSETDAILQEELSMYVSQNIRDCNVHYVEDGNKIENQTDFTRLESPYLIVSADTNILYSLIPEYIMVTRTDAYVLMIKKGFMDKIKTVVTNPLSNGTMISNDYFQYVTASELQISNKIQIPRGTYEILMKVNRLDNIPLNEHKQYGVLQVQNAGQIVREMPITDTGNLLITLSGQNGWKDITFTVLEQEPGSIYVELKGIQKVSDAYQINLREMNTFHSVYDETSGTITAQGDIIYGPYTNLNAGSYLVEFIFESDHPELISFDIVANNKDILQDGNQYTAIPQQNNFKIVLPIFSDIDLEKVEFRTHIPQTVTCILKSINILEQRN